MQFHPCEVMVTARLHHVNLQGLMTVDSQAVAMLQQQTRWV